MSVAVRLRAALLIAVAVAAGFAAAPTTAQPSTGAGSSSPDWSGWWAHRVPLPDEWRRNLPPLKPEVAAARAARMADADPDPMRWCRPQQFTGSSGGFTEAVEFLLTPGRVTITNEMGLIRRIYTDGRALPADPDPTNTGFSIGRWEGQTLVVETVGIDPAALYPGPQAGAVPIGAGARINERIFLTAAGTLQFDIVTEAPELLTEPDRRTRTYSRLPKTAANEITFCTDDDRSIEPGSGRQRFDLTPPADLPPPPGR